MTDYGFTIRHCDPQDPRDCIAYEQLKRGVTFAHMAKRPNYNAGEDLYYAQVGDEVISYVNVLPELGIERVVLDCRVSPKAGLGSVPTELFCHALEHARELGMRKAHVGLSPTDSDLAGTLSGLGFNEVRVHYELRLDLSKLVLEVAEVPGVTCCPLEAGKEGNLARIQNRSFAHTWAYNCNTVKDIRWRLEVKANSLDDVIFALCEGNVIGFCWTVPDCGQDSSTGRSKGQIYMMGVLPKHRRGGIGRRLLQAGLLHLKSKGREIIDLTVDSGNYGAVRLYYSEGFQLSDKTLWYEKIID